MPENYDLYEADRAERVRYYAAACAALAVLGFLFYRSIAASVVCTVFSKPLEKVYLRYRARSRKEKLLEGFRDVLYTISGSVSAGRQMPAAISDACVQTESAYGADSDIHREMRRICGIYGSAHGDIAELLTDFGRRSGLDEIRQFAASYEICRKSGGDVESVCLKSASLLLDKISFQSEVRSMTAQKKLDIALLSSMPVLVLLMLNLTSFSYVSPLYAGPGGRLLMTVCLAGIAAALLLSIRITEIDV